MTSDFERGNDNEHVKKYFPAMEAFIAGGITALEFETVFLEIHRNDKNFYRGEVSKYLQILFSDVGSYIDLSRREYVGDSGDPFFNHLPG